MKQDVPIRKSAVKQPGDCGADETKHMNSSNSSSKEVKRIPRIRCSDSANRNARLWDPGERIAEKPDGKSERFENLPQEAVDCLTRPIGTV